MTYVLKEFIPASMRMDRNRKIPRGKATIEQVIIGFWSVKNLSNIKYKMSKVVNNLFSSGLHLNGLMNQLQQIHKLCYARFGK